MAGSDEATNREYIPKKLNAGLQRLIPYQAHLAKYSSNMSEKRILYEQLAESST